MKLLSSPRTLLAGAVLLAGGLLSPAQAQADFDLSFLAHPAAPVYHAVAPVYTYQVPTTYYVPVAPVRVAPPPTLYQVETRLVPMAPRRAPVPPPPEKVEVEPPVQPKEDHVQIYSRHIYPHNPVVMVYPPMVMGFGQPVVMW
ncbi:MAG: hypothetical protein HQL72_02775 [Magnetococcales bacterium]|nr:hypothetical protein [Magnetococcales bacterium]